jgi:hypothetical protein
LPGIKVIIVRQKLARLNVALGKNAASHVASNIDLEQNAVGIARVVDESSQVALQPGINVPLGTQAHDVKIVIGGPDCRPLGQALLLFLFVNDFPDVFLNKPSFQNLVQADQSPTLAMLTLWLAFGSLALPYYAIATMRSHLAIGNALVSAKAFHVEHAIQAIVATGADTVTRFAVATSAATSGNLGGTTFRVVLIRGDVFVLWRHRVHFGLNIAGEKEAFG